MTVRKLQAGMEKLRGDGSERVQGTRWTQNSSKDSGATRRMTQRMTGPDWGFCVMPAVNGRYSGKADWNWPLSPCMGCKGKRQLERVQLKSDHVGWGGGKEDPLLMDGTVMGTFSKQRNMSVFSESIVGHTESSWIPGVGSQ